jgi:beta-glucosidase/6-phospho-beta-glucosidase/beta-galactosidase
VSNSRKRLTRYANFGFSVTENGFAVKDEHSKPIEEALQDDDRVNYFKGITASLKAAVLEDGVDVRAYFPWSMYNYHLQSNFLIVFLLRFSG